MEHEAATPKQPSAVKETRFSRDSRARERPRVDRFAELGELIGNRGAGLFLQAKLNVSRPDDPHEREADRIAETVLRMRDSASADESDVRMTQPKCDCTGPSSECPRCSDEQPRIQRASISASIGPLPHSQALDENHDEAEDKLIQAREDPGAPGSGAFDLVGYVDDLPGGGEPLPPAVRSVFEPRFGCDLSHVRIHTDAGAAESARAIGAMAYSAGSNIVFGHGQFQPRSHDGQRLIAHELTHAIQQTPLSARNVPFQHDGFTPAADTRATLAPHPGASQMIFRQPEPRAALRPCLTVGREGQG
ncbi:MAG TPA: DUF4157 domain-containing protein, partial [Blastocatellia bacterium]|nr:DUF4157 domain-containing protein [Blastocatellia bacterium]